MLTLKMIQIFFIFIFFWYAQVTEAPFNDAVKFVRNTFINLNSFFINEMRGAPAQSLLGEGFRRGIPYTIQFSLTWLTFVFIAIGVIYSIRKYKEISFPELNSGKLYFLKNKFEVEYWFQTIICSGFAVILISFPFVSKGYGIERAYPILITFLSVFFVIGGIVLSHYLRIALEKICMFRLTQSLVSKSTFNKLLFSKIFLLIKTSSSSSRPYLIILLVLIPYFLSTTGVIHELLGYPYQITLAEKETAGDFKYLIHDQESFSAKWLKTHTEDNAEIYADSSGANRLISQGNFSKDDIESLTKRRKEIKGYIYLTFYNVINEKLYDDDILTSYNLTKDSGIFMGSNNIYDNGASKIWFLPNNREN